MPMIPARWRRWLYTVSCAVVPVLVIAGWITDELGFAIVGLANAVFIGALASANTPRTDHAGD